MFRGNNYPNPHSSLQTQIKRYTKEVHDQQQISLSGGAYDDSLEHILDLGSKMGMNGELVDGSCF